MNAQSSCVWRYREWRSRMHNSFFENLLTSICVLANWLLNSPQGHIVLLPQPKLYNFAFWSGLHLDHKKTENCSHDGWLLKRSASTICSKQSEDGWVNHPHSTPHPPLTRQCLSCSLHQGRKSFLCWQKFWKLVGGLLSGTLRGCIVVVLCTGDREHCLNGKETRFSLPFCTGLLNLPLALFSILFYFSFVLLC